MGQVVKLMSECQTNVAIVAQVGEVHKRVAGDVYFRGQVLTVQPNAVIEGDLDVSAQAVQIYGEVKGEVKGVYQTLDRKGTQTGAE
jgi:cytoskeletal protein CcmA (bactofilin family)